MDQLLIDVIADSDRCWNWNPPSPKVLASRIKNNNNNNTKQNIKNKTKQNKTKNKTRKTPNKATEKFYCWPVGQKKKKKINLI